MYRIMARASELNQKSGGIKLKEQVSLDIRFEVLKLGELSILGLSFKLAHCPAWTRLSRTISLPSPRAWPGIMLCTTSSSANSTTTQETRV